MGTKTINIKCPCGAVVNHIFQPDTWPKDKVTRRSSKCPKCGKTFEYEVCGGKCSSWYR